MSSVFLVHHYQPEDFGMTRAIAVYSSLDSATSFIISRTRGELQILIDGGLSPTDAQLDFLNSPDTWLHNFTKRTRELRVNESNVKPWGYEIVEMPVND